MNRHRPNTIQTITMVHEKLKCDDLIITILSIEGIPPDDAKNDDIYAIHFISFFVVQ